MRETVRQAARATAGLVMAAALAFGTIIFITVLLITATLTLVVVGAGLLPETVLLIRRIAGAKRNMVAAWTGHEIPEAYRPIEGPLRQRLRTAVRGPGTFGDLRWMVFHYVYGFLGLLTAPLWLLGLPVDGVRQGLLGRSPLVLPLISRLADLDAAWSTALLKPSPEALLAVRVEELTETRAGAIAAHGAELRRIERDLHDGTQARLVALSMRIGIAKRAYEREPETALRLLEDAQSQAEEALTELRHVVRGIHPPILTDRGLAGAVRALAASSGLDVTVVVDGLEDGARSGSRAPAAVEAAAYFVVAESLTNAAKHSGSERAEVRLVRNRGGLSVRVADEGRGGAGDTSQAFGSGRAGGGSGLPGMRRRVAALDGTLLMTSPVGGPTVIEVELPCVW
ncbi:histidine kinase [Streptomyces sp. NBC_01728]|uniref:sensor histidine kinase n=1 Tax=unclassified Streptomyces TaxID=2593676 RepID=UPI0022554A91|nr:MULTISPECIES: histidine kinase [unclassified Streptomyces]MCX4454495.1 histidine kinase [Streptomyces sp. NBC_01719]MCX4493855.1 histidine kinase [Streptomyces sp. NBC_01728]